METLFAIIVGILFAISTYLILRRHLLRLLFGLILMSNAANLLLFTMGRLTRGNPPIIPGAMEIPQQVVANPLSQALVLTAIVINLGILAFMLVLVYRTEKELETVDADDLRVADGPVTPPRT